MDYLPAGTNIYSFSFGLYKDMAFELRAVGRLCVPQYKKAYNSMAGRQQRMAKEEKKLLNK